jgi:hypothetical protein
MKSFDKETEEDIEPSKRHQAQSSFSLSTIIWLTNRPFPVKEVLCRAVNQIFSSFIFMFHTLVLFY